MRAGFRRWGVGVLAGALVCLGNPASAAATTDALSVAAASPVDGTSSPVADGSSSVDGARGSVSLVVGLRPGAAGDATAQRLSSHAGVDATGTEALSGAALAVDVPAGRAADAATALRRDPAVSYVEIDHVARASAVPNDPAYSRQWGADLTGVTRTWNTARGARSVVIAVVDTGVKPVPDLAGRLLPGRDFVNDDDDASDDEGHGTMTAGVLGATANNRVGAAGICWYCRILPVKVLGADGSGRYSDIADGIRYAADRGADIINLSLSGTADSILLRSAVTHAVAKGAVVVAAAGNDGTRTRHYPAAFGNVLAVGASTVRDARYPWSSYGADWVDIAAPGCNPVQNVRGGLSQFCGTSSATPFVAGVAALLAATSPAPSAARIQRALTSSARPLSGNWVTASSGRIDAAAALRALRSK